MLSTTIRETTTAAAPTPENAPDLTVTAVARTTEEYASGNTSLWMSSAFHVAPWNFDDLSRDFGPNIYERMLWDPAIKAAHIIRKKMILAGGYQIVAAAQDPMEKWRADKRAAMDRFNAQEASRQASIAGAVDDPLHVPDPAMPTMPAKIPAPQPTLPDKPKPPTHQEELAAFCTANLDRLEPPIEDVLNDMLDAGGFGCRIAELTWEYVTTGKYAGKLMLKSLKPKPRSALAFVMDRFMNVAGLMAIKPGLTAPILVGSYFKPDDPSIKDALLPREKFAVLTNEPRDADPRGTSYFRAAYTAWWGKMQLYPEYLKYLAQFGSPSLIGYTSPNAGSGKDASGATVSAQQAMVNALATFRGGSALAFPYGAKVDVPMAGIQGRAFGEDFAHFNEEMSIAVLTFNPNTARQERGTATARMDTLAAIVRSDKQMLARMVIRDLLTPMILYNYGEGDRENIPTITFGGANQPDLAAELASMAQSGYALSPSQFPGLDQRYGFPKRSQDEMDALIKRAVAGSDPTPAPTEQPNRPNPGQDNASRSSGMKTGGMM